MDRCIFNCGGPTKIVFKENRINILKCRKCGHVYSEYDQEQDYGGYYEDEIDSDDHYWWNEAHRKMFDGFAKRYLTSNTGRILDVGCGLGYFLNYLKGFSGWEKYGSEMSKPAVRFARNKLGLENIVSGRTEDAGWPEKYFDVITMWDVIEHIPDPFPMLKYLRDILKDNGLLFIHTPNINIQLPKARVKKFLFKNHPSAHLLEAKDHINIYSPSSIKRLLKICGFSSARFVFLPPIQSVSGSKSYLLKTIKNIWDFSARAIYILSLKKFVFGNLFVEVRK